jgi:hypothetical protein
VTISLRYTPPKPVFRIQTPEPACGLLGRDQPARLTRNDLTVFIWRRLRFAGPRGQIRTGDPHVGKEMLGSISLRNFDRTGHIDAFRSIVGEGMRPGRFVFELVEALVLAPTCCQPHQNQQGCTVEKRDGGFGNPCRETRDAEAYVVLPTTLAGCEPVRSREGVRVEADARAPQTTSIEAN